MNAPRSSSSFWLRYLWPRAAAGCAALLAAVVVSIAIPYYMGRAIDALEAPDPAAVIPGLVAIVVGLAVVQMVARIGGFVLLTAVGRAAERDLRSALFDHLIRLDASFHRTRSPGDLMSRLTSDVTNISTVWMTGIIVLVGAGLLTLFASIAMFVIEPTLALWALLSVPLIIYASQWLGARIRFGMGHTQKQLGTLSATVSEDMAGIGVIRGYHLEAQRAESFERQSRELTRRRMAVQIAENAFKPLMSIFIAASMFAVLWIGGNAVLDRELSIGVLIQFNVYLAMLSSRITFLGEMWTLLQRGRASWTRLQELFAYTPTVADGPGPGFGTSVRGEVELRDLSVVVDGKKLLDGISLTIPAGTTCAIVGRVGCGKSTLLECLPRFIDVPAGSVFIDGRDITELPLADLRRTIAYAPQSPFLFSATIAENIAFGLEESADPTDRARVTRAADVAGLTPDLSSLKDGFETTVGERGITVSGGQRQRIALARTLANAHARHIVVLDDSLSSVDAETERRILDNLDRALAGKTRLLVSHRVAAIRRAHQIAVLDAGKLVEVGTHEALLAKNGLYADLYRAQLDEEHGQPREPSA